MSVSNFKRAIHRTGLGKKDREWSPAWVKRYAEFSLVGLEERLSLSRESVIKLSWQLKDDGVAAWLNSAK